MKMLVAACITLSLLAGCGIKGKLYIPQEDSQNNIINKGTND